MMYIATIVYHYVGGMVYENTFMNITLGRLG
jgi:hypothetical protein